MVENIIGILLVMIATMVLYAWGLLKERKEPYILQKKLWNKTKNVIIKSLKIHGKMEYKAIVKKVKHIQVSNFGSRKKLAILKPDVFVKAVLDDMEKNNIVGIDYSNNRKQYYLK